MVELPDGRRIQGRALRTRAPVDITPQLEAYLLGRAPTIEGWPSRSAREHYHRRRRQDRLGILTPIEVETIINHEALQAA